MSALLELLNIIKTQSGLSWLTPSQHGAVTSVESHLRLPGVVNLFGPSGVGKTFCGWMLARSHNGNFMVDPNLLSNARQIDRGVLVVDNAPDDLFGLRSLLTEMQMHNVPRAVVITRYRNELKLPAVVVPAPTVADFDLIAARLNSYYPFYSHAGLNNLWQWICMGFE